MELRYKGEGCSKQDIEYIATTTFNACQAMTNAQQLRDLMELMEGSKPVLASWKEIGSYIESVSLPLSSMKLG